jgi:hypothetical protein
MLAGFRVARGLVASTNASDQRPQFWIQHGYTRCPIVDDKSSISGMTF